MKNLLSGRGSTANESDPFAQYWARTASDPYEQYWARTSPAVEPSAGPNIHYSWAIDPVPEDESRGNRGVVGMVKKLNCASQTRERSSKLEHVEEGPMNAAAAQSWGPNEQDESEGNMGGKWQRLRTSCTSREASSYGRIGNWRSTSEPSIEETRFVSHVGVMSRTSNRTKAVERQYQREPLKSSIPSDSRGVLGNRKQPMSVRPKRLGKGFQLQNVARRGSDQQTTSSGEDSGSNQTGGSAVSYSDTDYTTTDNSSDDSVARYDRKTGGQERANGRPLSRATRRSTSRRRRSSKSRGKQETPLDILWTAVAQDLGILAGFVLADGKACVGSVSDIAQETMGESCNSSG
jgi:hypothetical protein